MLGCWTRRRTWGRGGVCATRLQKSKIKAYFRGLQFTSISLSIFRLFSISLLRAIIYVFLALIHFFFFCLFLLQSQEEEAAADRNICLNMSKFIRQLALRAHGNLWTVVRFSSVWLYSSFMSLFCGVPSPPLSLTLLLLVIVFCLDYCKCPLYLINVPAHSWILSPSPSHSIWKRLSLAATHYGQDSMPGLMTSSSFTQLLYV